MKRKRDRQGKWTHPDAAWDAWIQCDAYHLADGTTRPIPKDEMVFQNNHYEVNVRGLLVPEPFGKMVWLSIKRRDKRSLHDWRDLQRIKNELVGRELEAVELYPAESRLVDTSNQYHLFVAIEGYKFPFGFQDRLVMDDSSSNHPLLANAVQRPFRPGEKPADILTSQQAEEKFSEILKDKLRVSE